jgi:alpha-amylase
MRKILSIALLSLLFTVTSHGKSAEEWKKRAVYQLVTDRFAKGSGDRSNCDLSRQPYYCGGDFDGIKKNLQYIKNLGFDAIWISPVVDNTENGFHGYWARNWNKINDHFGGEQGLHELI